MLNGAERVHIISGNCNQAWKYVYVVV